MSNDESLATRVARARVGRVERKGDEGRVEREFLMLSDRCWRIQKKGKKGARMLVNPLEDTPNSEPGETLRFAPRTPNPAHARSCVGKGRRLTTTYRSGETIANEEERGIQEFE